MKKIIMLGSFLLVISFAFTASADELRTYYNNKVPYSAFFGYNKKQIKIQKTVNGQTVQAVVPAVTVNTKEEDKTQKVEKDE